MKMRRILPFAAAVGLCCLSAACRSGSLSVEICNPAGFERKGELAEVPLDRVREGLASETFLIKDRKGKEVPYQLTYDGKVLFPVEVAAKGTARYRICPGTPAPVDTVACGRVHPERMDDLAWENDLVAFRAYGPKVRKVGERAFGYDIFTKRGGTAPALPQLYGRETDPAARAEIARLKQTDPAAAERLKRDISYHIDHGRGMDCYAVGPTLGAGVAALMDEDGLVYPWCYEECTVLDNGPLRFTARLVFPPLQVGEAEVIETRLVSLDKGSHLNRTCVSYSGLTEELPIAAGPVLHDESGCFTADTLHRFVAYRDPTNGEDNGCIFVGAAFTRPATFCGVRAFGPEEREERKGAYGHLLYECRYAPGTEFTYWWGCAWDRSDNDDITSFQDWNARMERFSAMVNAPLQVSFGDN